MCHVERRLCTTSTYSYRLSPFFLHFFSLFSPFLLRFFSVSSPFLLRFFSVSLYVSRSPNLLRPFSFSPKFLEVFSPSHYVRRFFSYRRSGAGAIVPVHARIAKLSCSGSILAHDSFIVQEKRTVIFPVGEGLPDAPGTW